MQGALLVAATVLVGCGGAPAPGQPAGDAPPAPEPSDGARSGSRLEINYWQASDGFRTWTGTFHDSQLGVDCTVQPWSDGNTYCTPTPDGWSLATQRGLWDYPDNVALAPPWDGAAGQIEYSDAACTQAIAAVQRPSNSSAAYFTDSTSNGCSFLYRWTVNHLYHLQGMVSVTQGPYVLTPYGCMAGGTTTDDLYFAFDEVAPTSLVRVTRQIASSTDRVTMVSLVSDDGMVLPMGPYDRDLASPCYMHQHAGVEYCVPVDPAYDAPNRERADPACTTVLAASAASCTAPLTSVTADSPEQFNPDSFTSIAAPATEIYALGGGGSCAPATPRPDYAYYVRGPVVTLATGARVHDNLPGQRLDYVRVEAGSYAGRETALYDQALASECKLTVSAGRIVCAPIPSCGTIVQVMVDGCGSPTSFFDATGCSTTPRFVFDASNTLKVVGPEVTVTSCHSEPITLPPPCDCSDHVTAHALEDPTDADLAQLVSFVLAAGP